MTADHALYDGLILDFLEDRLSPADLARLERTLCDDPACAARFAMISRHQVLLADGLRILGDVPPSPWAKWRWPVMVLMVAMLASAVTWALIRPQPMVTPEPWRVIRILDARQLPTPISYPGPLDSGLVSGQQIPSDGSVDTGLIGGATLQSGTATLDVANLTRLALIPDAEGHRRCRMDGGWLSYDAGVEQRPLNLMVPEGTVVGTRFITTTGPGGTWIQVEAGSVQVVVNGRQESLATGTLVRLTTGGLIHPPATGAVTSWTLRQGEKGWDFGGIEHAFDDLPSHGLRLHAGLDSIDEATVPVTLPPVPVVMTWDFRVERRGGNSDPSVCVPIVPIGLPVLDQASIQSSVLVAPAGWHGVSGVLVPTHLADGRRITVARAWNDDRPDKSVTLIHAGWEHRSVVLLGKATIGVRSIAVRLATADEISATLRSAGMSP